MLLISKIYAQIKKIPEDFGFRHLSYKFQNDRVDVIVISKHGEERIAKPLLLFCHKNLPQPVIVYDEKGLHPPLPFDELPFLDNHHIAIIAQPAVPVIANSDNLIISTPSKGFTLRNHIDYYVYRNNFILKELIKERWAARKKIVVVGMEEGAAIASKMAFLNKKITHLVYANANPYGHIMDMVAKNNSAKSIENLFSYWQSAVDNSKCVTLNNGYKSIYDFSIPQRDNLMALKIPVFVAYDSGSDSSVFNDFFQIETITAQKSNFTFSRYGHDSDSSYGELASNCLQWLNQFADE
jgi:hypothetical protein